MSNDPDYIVELSQQNLDSPKSPAPDISPETSLNRPYISVLFECCQIYLRIYRNPAATAYEGRCPRCLRPITIRIGSGGTNTRFFTAR